MLLHSSREDSREGGRTDTHTIDERWEDPLLLRAIEDRCSGAWDRGAAAAPWGEQPRARGGVEAAAAPPIHGGQLSGDATSPPRSARAEEHEALLRAPFGTKLLPMTMLVVDAAPPQQTGGIDGIGIGIITIGIGASVAIDSVPCFCSAASCRCRLAPSQVESANPPRSGERSEEPPTPSLT